MQTNKPPVWATPHATDPQTQRVIDLVQRGQRAQAEADEIIRQQTEGKRFADAQHPRGYKHD
jgi:hypothetical protein